MIRYTKLRYLIPTLIALAMIIFGSYTSIVNTRDNLRVAKRVANSRNVLDRLQETFASILDLETGQRGFVIVGEDSYLEPYHAAMKRLDDQVANLSELTRDNAFQQIRVGMIREIIVHKEKSLTDAIETRRRSGLDAAATIIKNGSGKDEMARFRQTIQEMRTEELSHLEKHQNALSTSLTRTNRTVVITGCVAITAGVIGAILLALFLAARDRENSEREHREKAESADRAKSDFLAMMSHEIRTPLNAILGFGELLNESVETPQQKHFCTAILSSGNSLLSLINDILDLSKIEAGKLSIHEQTVVIAIFAKKLHTLFSFRAAEKGLQYSVDVDPSVPALLIFDDMRLRQVLVNLIGNAIKFTREGAITAVIRADAIAVDDSVMLHIEVTDTGIGIAKEHLSEIFRPFYQIDSRRGRQYQGTGLGLSICSRLIEAMNGKIRAESTPGAGSVFHVSLPTRFSRLVKNNRLTETEDFESPVDFQTLKPSKILIVDDEPLNRELIRSYLANSSHQVIEAENGEEAVARCVEHMPDVVLMDIRMPAMDGREALARIREREDTRHIPLIALSASSLLNSQVELRTIFDSFTDKPISRSKLYQELAKFIPVQNPPKDASISNSPTEDPLVLVTQDFDPLCEQLEHLHSSVWPSLAKLVPAQGTSRFAITLSTLAETYSCPVLAKYTRQLSLAAETMDLNEAGRLLQKFPNIIVRLRDSHD